MYRGEKMNRDSKKRYKKIDDILIKMSVGLFVILLMTQWYLRIFNEGIEHSLNKLYGDKGLNFKVIEIVSDKSNKSEK